ncbi:MAG: aspartate/glutamate racemase family protein, partial [Deltaproteobacteria bacterium]|nr:aspartate/glutamate racemase family protein [Deltaproteobacteria bacterium]
MKTIGLIGGMSWESSLAYYRIINETTRARLGGLHSAKSIMYSVDFSEIEALQHQGNWEELVMRMINVARNIEKGGADFVIICTNTMHKMAEDVQNHITIPLLHIADVTADKIKSWGMKTVALLGTRFTMEEDFYKDRLIRNYGLEVMLPPTDEMQIVHDVIFNELCVGEIKKSSRKQYVDIMERLMENGAEGIILGCTEIGLLVQDQDCRVP